MLKKIKCIIIGILSIVAIPFIIYFLVHMTEINSFYVFGFKIELFDFLTDRSNIRLEFKDYLVSVCALIGIIITSFLSYLIWELNKKSVKISERLIELEFDRDSKIVVGSSAMISIVSYSIIDYLHKLSNGCKNIKFPYFNEDFLKSTEKLYGVLSSSDLAFIFEFYNDFKDLEVVLKKENSPKLIEKLADKYFESSSLEYSFYDFHRKPEFQNILNLLKIEYQDILGRIDNIAKKKSFGEFNYPREINAFYKNGAAFSNILIQKDGRTIKKFWDLNGKLLEDTVSDENGITGYKVDFNRKVKVFEGYYEFGKRHRGTEYFVKISDSDGYDYFEEQSSLNAMIERAEFEENHFDEILEKNIDDGQIEYDEYCTATWDNGKRSLNLDTTIKEPRWN